MRRSLAQRRVTTTLSCWMLRVRPIQPKPCPRQSRRLHRTPRTRLLVTDTTAFRTRWFATPLSLRLHQPASPGVPCSKAALRQVTSTSAATREPFYVGIIIHTRGFAVRAAHTYDPPVRIGELIDI